MKSTSINVLLLGTAFHLIFFGYQTSVFIQQTVVNSLKAQPDSSFTGDGYVSLCVTYVIFSLSNWLAPSIVALTGLKYGMFFASLMYIIYAASFIYPTTIIFYTVSALIGLGAAVLWTAQGSYLAENSTSESSSRNAAIFWSMLQSGILFGNIFVYLAFNQQTSISENTRFLIYGVLTIVCGLGASVLLLLRTKQQVLTIGQDSQVTPKVSALGQFTAALDLARTPCMLLLSFSFLFSGIYQSFFTGIYGTAIGATSQFGADSKKYIGLSGVFIGIGEIFGGSLFGLLGSHFSKIFRRDTVIMMGFITTVIAFALVYVNLPADASLVQVAKAIPIIEPRVWLAMLTSILLGFGDACFNTQIYSLLMSAYSNKSVAAFTFFKFVQSVGAAIAFLYSTTLNLHYQIYLMVIIITAATLSFCFVEWKFQSKQREPQVDSETMDEFRQESDLGRKNLETSTEETAIPK